MKRHLSISSSSGSNVSDLPRIIITAGEPAGIGPDVTLIALQSHFDAKIAVIGSLDVLRHRAHALDIQCNFQAISPDSALEPHAPGVVRVYDIAPNKPVIPGQLNVANASHVVDSLSMAIGLLKTEAFDAVVTGPAQKSIINEAGTPFSGHTEFFSESFGCDNVVMMLVNETLRVALATTHMPLRRVPDAISKDSIDQQLTIIDEGIRRLYGIAKPRIVMLGLNPHAGENGHLGSEEIDTLIPGSESAIARGVDVSLPIPADTAFVSPQAKTADVIFAMYHDQGLPVLKTLGFGASVNITLGLPIIRTSVDHGTALEIAGTGKASASSMTAAIREAIYCSRNKALEGEGQDSIEG